MNRQNRNRIRFSLAYLAIALLGMWLLQTYVLGPLLTRQTEVAYNVFRRDIERGDVDQVTIEAFYRLQLTDNLQVTPGFHWTSKSGQNESIWVGSVLRISKIPPAGTSSMFWRINRINPEPQSIEPPSKT